MYFIILYGAPHISAGFITVSSATEFTSENTNNNSDTTNSQDLNDRVEQVKLRSSYKSLSVKNIQNMSHTEIHKEKEWGFYGYSTIKHDYVLKEIDIDKVVIDHAT